MSQAPGHASKTADCLMLLVVLDGLAEAVLERELILVVWIRKSQCSDSATTQGSELAGPKMFIICKQLGHMKGSLWLPHT